MALLEKIALDADAGRPPRFTSIVDGKPVHADGSALASINPADGEPVADLVGASPEVVAAAVESAAAAHAGWRRVKPAERGRLLNKLAATILEHREEMALLETLEMGQPISTSRSDVDIAARYFEFFAGAADKFHGDTIPLGDQYLSYTRHEPFGVIGMVLPWNAPLQQAARGLAPALAAGNTVVVKPSEETSLTTLVLAHLAVEVGFPRGVFNVVIGTGPDVGQRLVDHAKVAKVCFTGSVRTGSRIMESAARRVIPVSLELGGKSPNIIFDDADLDAAVASSWTAFTLKSGQVCSAGTRLLVHRSVVDEVVDRLVARADSAILGPGVEDPDLGPLASERQLNTVLGYLNLAVDEGARVAVGGRRATDGPLGNGFYVLPTVLTDVSNTMQVAREEIFGPIVVVIPFDTDDEAIALANDSEYGLAAGVWTSSLSRAHNVARELVAGQVFVNQYFAGGVETPFGGFKNSGFGREKGLDAMRHYVETKTITVRL